MPIPPVQEPTPTTEEQRLAPVAEFREYLLDKGGQVDTDALELLLDGASERLNAVRQFYPSTGTRTIPVDGETFVRIPDLNLGAECTVLADGVELTANRLRFMQRRGHPAHAVVLYQAGVRQLVITGKWGFDPTPPGIVAACMDWAAYAHFRRQARQADMTANESGQSTYFARTPSIVKAALQPYEVPGL